MSEHVSVNQDTKLRGADQQQTTRRTRNLLYEGPSVKQYAHSALQQQAYQQSASSTAPPVLLPDTDAQTDWSMPGLRLQAFEIHNRAAAAIVVGIGFRLRNTIWHAGIWTTADSTYAKNRAHQSRTATAWQTTTAADGFIIASRKKFNWLSMNVTTASVGATGDLTVQYSNEAGTGWITQTTAQSFLDDFTVTDGVTATGERVFVWNPPHDWGKSLGLETSLEDGMYCMRILIGAQAYSTASVATGIEIGTLKSSGEELADNGLFENEQMSWTEPDADGVVGFFETAAPGNSIDFEVAPAG